MNGNRHIVSHGPDLHLVDQVDPLTAIQPFPNIAPMQPNNPSDDMLSIREQFPFLPILPFPRIVRTYFLATANTAQDIDLSQFVIVAFRGNGDYYLCMDGAAVVPTAGIPATSSIYKPEGNFFYAGNMQSCSIVAPNANCIVTAYGYHQNLVDLVG